VGIGVVAGRASIRATVEQPVVSSVAEADAAVVSSRRRRGWNAARAKGRTKGRTEDKKRC
jgi:DNA invertase Pin-like site-specific DNA recombinase